MSLHPLHYLYRYPQVVRVYVNKIRRASFYWKAVFHQGFAYRDFSVSGREVEANIHLLLRPEQTSLKNSLI
jgi:hypothetical protein